MGRRESAIGLYMEGIHDGRPILVAIAMLSVAVGVAFLQPGAFAVAP